MKNKKYKRLSADPRSRAVPSMWLFALSVANIHALAAPSALLPITGTFWDFQYDGRMKYSTGVAASMSCHEWAGKVDELVSLGIDTLIFQCVHDKRWGAYYNSSFLDHAKLGCADPVWSVMHKAAEVGIKIFLSCEFAGTDEDRVTDGMATRLKIMHELVEKGYTDLKSFEGWYFSSEAYISPYFHESFLAYIKELSSRARKLTPSAKTLTSPFGTESAVADPTFIGQLSQIDVDIIAYQDEVGCVRNPMPVVTSAAAFEQLAKAHSAAGRPKLWANIESFTWENAPDNVSSALIPAAFPRIAAQIAAVTRAGVSKIVSFTTEGLYQPPGRTAPTWGPASAVREYTEYRNMFLMDGPSTTYAAVLKKTVQGRIQHQAVGAKVTLLQRPSASYTSGNLTDGITGTLSTSDRAWKGFEEVDFAAVVDLSTPVCIKQVAVNFLQAPQITSVYLPLIVTFWVTNSTEYLYSQTSPFTDTVEHYVELGSVTVKWWEQEIYDTRSELFILDSNLISSNATLGCGQFLRVEAKGGGPSLGKIAHKVPLDIY